MSSMGAKNNQFDIPVCNSFEAKILNDQLCYEIDPNRFKNKISSKEFKQGFTFYVDTNIEKQIASYDDNFMIYLDTIGMFC